MFPLKDENPTELTPVATVAFIGANVLAWLFVQSAGMGPRFIESLCSYGAIPGEITGSIASGAAVSIGEYLCPVQGSGAGTLLTSMFLHGSWMHLIGNMWFLWVFGNNIEDSMGHLRFVVFYLLTGLIAAGCHILSSVDSPVPTVGASGAISGVMGAYMVLYPRVRVQTLIIFVFIQIVRLPAVVLLGLWFAIQFLQGTLARGAGGVAFWAHIGGFAGGVLLIKLFARPRLVQAKLDKRVLDAGELGRWDRW